ncbi:hypothetical protein ABZP36_020765 [Zizania latifolia]
MDQRRYSMEASELPLSRGKSEITRPSKQQCYWKNHPDQIISCIGSLGSIVGSFGDVCGTFFGGKLQTLKDALCNKRSDCYGDLLREGAAAYINSVAAKKAKFAYTTQHVKDCILIGLTSKAAAIEQAAMFKKANLACHY